MGFGLHLLCIDCIWFSLPTTWPWIDFWFPLYWFFFFWVRIHGFATSVLCWACHGQWAWLCYHFFFFFLIKGVPNMDLISLRISKVDDLALVDYQWWWKAYKKQTQSKRRPEKTGQTPSDGKVSFTGMKFRLILGVKCSRDFLLSFCSDRSFI